MDILTFIAIILIAFLMTGLGIFLIKTHYNQLSQNHLERLELANKAILRKIEDLDAHVSNLSSRFLR
jgi:DNA-binding transcriptional MerR regulator